MSQPTVQYEKNAELFADYQTPYKLNRPILAPSGEPGDFDALGVDNMRIFRHKGRFYATYIGFDGVGYQTALAVSDDLIEWQKLGVIFPRGSANAWDRVGRAVSCWLHDVDLYGNRELIVKDGKYWMFYHAYPDEGYEGGSAANGLAWTEDDTFHDWHFLDKPVFEKAAEGEWDGGGLYSVWVVPFENSWRMYYNGKNNLHWPWKEQSGLALPEDDTLTRWRRYEHNPVHPVSESGWDSVFACGQHVLWDSRRKRWVLFFCGFDGNHAQEGVSISDDGIHWRRFAEPLIRCGEPGSIDSKHAHKPCVIYHNGALYHFYCAVRPTETEEERRKFGKEFRCLTVARSTPF